MMKKEGGVICDLNQSIMIGEREMVGRGRLVFI